MKLLIPIALGVIAGVIICYVLISLFEINHKLHDIQAFLETKDIVICNNQ